LTQRLFLHAEREKHVLFMIGKAQIELSEEAHASQVDFIMMRVIRLTCLETNFRTE
jgi:hypothetical protein